VELRSRLFLRVESAYRNAPRSRRDPIPPAPETYPMPHVLIAVEQEEARQALARQIRAEAFTVAEAEGVEVAIQRIDDRAPDLLLAGLCFSDGSAVSLLDRARDAGVGATVLVDEEDAESVQESLKDGVTGFLARPFETEKIRELLQTVATSLGVSEEIAREQEKVEEGRFGRLVGGSRPMRRLYDLISRIAPSQATVLITGESGSGKEVVAHTIHELSRRRREPFVPVNCGAITPSLMESELFGHEKGAFTGASRQHRGFFEQADGGTLFLDEVTEMPADVQVKLLRVLESGDVTRVGAEASRSVDVRILAATNRVPETAVEEGVLREDLFYRLAVLPLAVPPLRDRLDDVPLLARHMLDAISRKEGMSRRLPDETLAVLQDYEWPGNVRQLRNAVYTAFLLSQGSDVEVDCLPPNVRGGVKIDLNSTVVQVPVGTSIKEAERRLILTTLAHYDGRKTATAETLGISVRTLYNRLHEYGYMDENEGEDPE
jgi:two-component system, NtrC family, response regulator AtoC